MLPKQMFITSIDFMIHDKWTDSYISQSPLYNMPHYPIHTSTISML